jgi:hypothetical protein
LRQGSAADAEQIAAQFGTVWCEEVSRSSDGRTTTRLREEPRVYASSLLQLPTAHGWLRVAPIGTTARERVEHVVFAVPARPKMPSRLALPPAGSEPRSEPGEPCGSVGGSPVRPETEVGVDNDASGDEAENRAVRDGTHRHPEPDFSSVDGQKRAVYRRVKTIDGWRCWRGLFDHDGWPQMWGQRPYKLIYEWEQSPIPPRWTIDHACGLKDCLDHLAAVTRGENLRRRHARERGELAIGHAGMTSPGGTAEVDVGPDENVAPNGQELAVEARRAEVRRLRAEGWSVRRIAAQLGVGYGTVRRDAEVLAVAVVTSVSATSFTIALFAAIDRPAVEQRTLSLDELRQLLSRFEVLDDKRRGRCWSPTQYADSTSSRSNAGVAEVSCLVFDCDRVPPDEDRLSGVYWVGHTTHSHTPQAPRWRVVIPLAAPVPVQTWNDIWRRARAALCPEADPACKDASRAYWLPSHNGGVSAKATCHEGPLLDPTTLPELLVERRLGRVPRITVGDDKRSQAYMHRVIDNLASAAPGGRNAALNRAAWTLGGWVAAGALDQREVEDALYAAAKHNGLVSDDGARQCWATIRSGLSAGLQQSVDLEP